MAAFSYSRIWHMDVPTGEAREPLKTALFKGEMRVRHDAASRSLQVNDDRLGLHVHLDTIV